MTKDLKTGRTTPPDDDEWGQLWSLHHKTNRMWPIVAPFVAVYENWKALAAVAAVVAFVRGPEVIALLAEFLGVAQ